MVFSNTFGTLEQYRVAPLRRGACWPPVWRHIVNGFIVALRRHREAVPPTLRRNVVLVALANIRFARFFLALLRRRLGRTCTTSSPI